MLWETAKYYTKKKKKSQYFCSGKLTCGTQVYNSSQTSGRFKEAKTQRGHTQFFNYSPHTAHTEMLGSGAFTFHRASWAQSPAI